MDIIRDPDGPLMLGDPTITRGRPCYDDGEAIPPADVESITVFAYRTDVRDPFWTLSLTVADVLSETASTVGWNRDDVGWTFRHELLYDAAGTDGTQYQPPLGTVWLDYVMVLTSGARKSWVRAAEYVPGRAVHGGLA